MLCTCVYYVHDNLSVLMHSIKKYIINSEDIYWQKNFEFDGFVIGSSLLHVLDTNSWENPENMKEHSSGKRILSILRARQDYRTSKSWRTAEQLLTEMKPAK